MSRDPHTPRWFESIGGCADCGKSAHGTLRGGFNQALGVYCRRCADRRLKEAEQKRTA
jgi:hypothetical protein